MYVVWKISTFILVNSNDHFSGLPRMEALIRIANIPLVETGVKTAGNIYHNLKVSFYVDIKHVDLFEQCRFCHFIHGFFNYIHFLN